MGKHKQFDDADQETKPKIGLLKEETLNYYRRVSESLESGFDNDEDKDLFVSNVVTQLSEEAISVSQNQTASRIVEVLVSFCGKDQVTTLFSAFSKDWQTACTDRFASHVCQKLMLRSCALLQQEKGKSKEKEDKKTFKSLENLLLELCDFLEADLKELICDTYSSHITRVMLEVLGGVLVEDKLVRSKLSRDSSKATSMVLQRRNNPKSLSKRFLTFSEKIMNLDDLQNYLTETLPSTVIQTLLLILKQYDEDLCQEYCQKILELSGFLTPSDTEVSTEADLPSLVKNVSGSYLVEQLLALSSAEGHQEIVNKVFMGRCLQFAVDSQANFVFQHLLSTIKEADQFKLIFKELSGHIEDILAIQHLGVISKMAETCQRLNCYQDKFIKALMKAFHCYKPAERQKAILPSLTSMSTYEILYPTATTDEEERSHDEDAEADKSQSSTKTISFSQVNLHGSIITQHMLKFESPTAIVDSVLALTSPQLVELTSNPCGSHVIDVFFKSSTVHQNSKQHMIHKLKGTYMDLACSKNASRALQTVWDCSSLKQKMIIAEELSKQESKLQSDKFGRFAHRNFALHHFINRRQDWKELQGAKAKKRKMFEDIFKDSDFKSKKGSKNLSSKEGSNLHNEEDKNEGFDIGDLFRKKSFEENTGSNRGRGRGGLGRGRFHGRGQERWKGHDRGRGRGQSRRGREKV